MSTTTTKSYAELYREAQTDAAAFWLNAANLVDWAEFPQEALDVSDAPLYHWFPDGKLNVCDNAVDRHVRAGRGDQVAIRFDSAMTGTQRNITYTELQDEVARFAGVLRASGVDTGDRVAIYMPMIPEALVAMLACARIGAIHSVIFGGFAAAELATRLEDSEAKAIVTTSGGIEPSGPIAYLPIVRAALERVVEGETEPSVRSVIVKDRLQVDGSAAGQEPVAGETWIDWDEAMAEVTGADPVVVDSTHPLYILYTSGTTGVPKGVVRDSGGYAVALVWSMKNVYNVHEGDVMWTASDVGWVVGHSYITYGPLIAGATTVLYEGKPIGTPDAAQFWRLIERHGVKVLFTAPTAMRAVRRTDPDLAMLGEFNLDTLETVFLAGERLDTETYNWLADAIERPVVDHWWQTETGWPITANPRGIETLPVKPGSSTVPMPGYQVEIVSGKGEPREAGNEGNVVIKLPLPPGTLPTLWRGDDRYQSAYLSAFPGYYATGDNGFIDEDGYVFLVGRADDVINVAGHRLSTGQLEEAVGGHHSVAECCVVGVPDELKGERPVSFVTLKSGELPSEAELRDDILENVRGTLGPVASLKDVFIVPRLPKTRSGKILRKTIRQILAGEQFKVPATIEDPAVLDEIQHAVAAHAASAT